MAVLKALPELAAQPARKEILAFLARTHRDYFWPQEKYRAAPFMLISRGSLVGQVVMGKQAERAEMGNEVHLPRQTYSLADQAEDAEAMAAVRVLAEKEALAGAAAMPALWYLSPLARPDATLSEP